MIHEMAIKDSYIQAGRQWYLNGQGCTTMHAWDILHQGFACEQRRKFLKYFLEYLCPAMQCGAADAALLLQIPLVGRALRRLSFAMSGAF